MEALYFTYKRKVQNVEYEKKEGIIVLIAQDNKII